MNRKEELKCLASEFPGQEFSLFIRLGSTGSRPILTSSPIATDKGFTTDCCDRNVYLSHTQPVSLANRREFINNWIVLPLPANPFGRNRLRSNVILTFLALDLQQSIVLWLRLGYGSQLQGTKWIFDDFVQTKQENKWSNDSCSPY